MSTVRTSDYSDVDTSGWTQTSSDPNSYQSDRTIRRDSEAVLSGYSKVRIITDTTTGNFQVYKINVGSDNTSIFSYDSSSNDTTIDDESLYSEFFVGPEDSTIFTQNLKDITLSTKQSSLALASQNATTEVEESNLQTLEQSKGYQSLSNTGSPSPSDGEDGSVPESGTQSANSTPSTNIPTVSLNRGFLSKGIETTPANPGAVYRYPLNIPELGYDFIQITSYEYVRAGLPTPGRQSAARRLFNLLNRPLERIILPMQPNLSETNSVDWGGDKLNAIEGTMAQGALGAIQGLSNFDTSAVKNAAGSTIVDLKQFIQDPALGPFIAAYFAGQAVGKHITARATGQVINPNLELLFSGPRLRTFNFNFTFTPRSSEEALEIKKIIKTFKRNSAPQRSTSSLFLKTPRIFKLEYIYNDTDNQHPFLNKFKPCAMTNLAVNYTPDGSYMTYDNGSLTSYALSMSFGEIEPIYADEIEDNWDDMGF